MSGVAAPMLFAGESVDVLGLEAAATLALVVAEQRREDAAAAAKLRAVTHWADLHRADGVGAAHPEAHREWVGQPLLGREGSLRLAGEGAFTVEEFAVAELAAALQMTEPAARAMVGQALELRDRLPRLWAQVMGGRLAAWRGRQVAAETIPLTAAAAAYVDAHLAPFAHQVSVPRILRAVRAAVLAHDPVLARERAAAAAERKGVWLLDGLDGTTTITAVTGTPDAVTFDAALNTLAATMSALGDPDRVQVRRSKAVGVLADPQYALDLISTADAAPGHTVRSTQAPTLHVHLHQSAVEGVGVARVVGHEPCSVATVERWLADLAPGAVVKMTPVVDLTDRIAVDAYEIPDRLRAQVDERDHGCVFPWCGRTGRFDVDHIDPYVAPDEGGPPGQTRTENLARLCRFHHRVKTHGDWVYQRHPDGSLTWTSPLGRSYSVDRAGTIPHR